MAHHDRCIRECVIALAKKGGLSVSTAGELYGVPISLQGNCYGNTGGITKLEGVRELGCGAFPAQIRILH